MRLRLVVPRSFRRRGPILFVGVALVLALATIGAVVVFNEGDSSAAAKPNTVRVERGNVELRSSAAGTVKSSSTRGLSFSTSGTLTEVDVKAGDQVTAGQVLARIDPSDAQDAVDQAQSKLDDADDALSKAVSASASASSTKSAGSTNSGNSGNQVQTCVAAAAYLAVDDSPSASPSPSIPASSTPSPSVTASPTQTQTQTTSPDNGGRGGSGGTGNGNAGTGNAGGVPTCPTGRGGTTGGNGAAAGSGGNTAAGGNGAAGANGGSGARSGTDSLYQAQISVANADLALKQAQAKLAGTTITAPVSGRVLTVSGSVGAAVSPGGTGFIVLGGLTDIAVSADFSEADIASLAVGQTASVTLPNTGRDALTGKVSQINPTGTVSGKLVRYGVLIAFDQAPTDLLIGQKANVTVTTSTAADVLYALSSAVTGVADGKGTVTVRSAGRDERRTVGVGLRGEQYTELTSGVAAGDELVISSAS